MHDTFFRVLTIVQDVWQNVAILALIGDRLGAKQRARRREAMQQ